MKIVDKYSKFVSYNPFIVLILVILLSLFAMQQAKNIAVKNMDYKTMLPDDVEVIQANNLVSDSFGGTDSAMIAIEIDPNYINSNEPRDVREPEIITYIHLLTESSKHIDNVLSVTSASSVLTQLNSGILPKSKREIIDLAADNALAEQYISKDNQMALVKILLIDGADENEFISDLEQIIREVPKPAGISVNPAGEIAMGPIINKLIPKDMASTSKYSLIGIIIILLVLFRSVKYGFTPLSAIGVGIVWAMGYIGLRHMGMNSATSGVISMIMGVGIDFGIQVSNRYRQELAKNNANEAMRMSLNNVIIPMLTTTLAALIGFKAMAMGELTLMGEMGTMMSYGITACFLAAITIVPALMVLFEKITFKRKHTLINVRRNKI